MTVSRRGFLQTTSVALSAPFLVKFLGDRASAALPASQYLVPFTDSKFGNKVVKVTNPNNPVPGLNLIWEKVATHHYSIDQAWNADQSLLLLDRGTSPGRVFLDGKTYKPVFALKNPGAIRWHRTNPAYMVFVGSKGLGYWDVRKNTIQVLSSLSGYSKLDFGENKGNLSDDGTMLVITATRSDGKKVAFAYRLSSGRKYPDIDMSGWYEVGWTTISPKGTYVVSYSRKTKDSTKQRLIFTLDGKLVQNWTEYERPGHGDFMVDSKGDEVAIGRSKSDSYRMISRRLVDGKITFLSDRCQSSHTSARNLRNPGWVFGSFTPDPPRSGAVPASNEIAAISTDGAQSLRHLAQHNSVPNGYYTEPHGSPSPDGKKAIFASNWGVKDGPIAAYVAEFTS
jgi:hypothetical protein